MSSLNVMIIAGHGGNPYDPGAVGCGLKEAVETRRLANALKPRLEAYGVNVTMYDQNKNAYDEIRYGRGISLAKVQYVLELHMNAGVSDTSGNGRITGTEILVDASEAGITVEQAILNKICALGFTNRGVKRRNDLLVMNTVTNAGVSHALIETAFIDDKDDVDLYSAKFNQIAQAIADGVAVGFGLTKEQEEKDMTEAEVKKIIADEDAKKTYDTIDELPFGKDTIEKLIKKGLLAGEGDGKLGITYDLLRVLVINDRAGVYGE